jgi:hypothetical protein
MRMSGLRFRRGESQKDPMTLDVNLFPSLSRSDQQPSLPASQLAYPFRSPFRSGQLASLPVDQLAA